MVNNSFVGENSPNPTKVIGYLSKSIANKTNGLYTAGPIYISDNNIRHIKNAHPEDYEKYFPRLTDIINSPDYIGINPRDNSLQLIKVFDNNVLVALRTTKSGVLFVRSLYHITSEKFNLYLSSGTLIKCP